MNPDEVVAVGAAVQGGVLAGDVKDILLLDVTPLSLGVETLGGVMTKLIERNTTIPTKKAETFSTAADGQTQVEIHVLQGEREMAGDNRTLGRFQLTGIPPAARGVPQVEVTFDIDANGILNVNAKDKATAKEQSITITHSSGLNKAEVEKMVSDARTNEAADKERREMVELKNRAENLSYQMEKLLKENKREAHPESATQLESAIQGLNAVREGTDKAALQSAMTALEEASHKAAEEMYRAAGSRRRWPRCSRGPGRARARGRGSAEEGRRRRRRVPHQLTSEPRTGSKTLGNSPAEEAPRTSGRTLRRRNGAGSLRRSARASSFSSSRRLTSGASGHSRRGFSAPRERLRSTCGREGKQ